MKKEEASDGSRAPILPVIREIWGLFREDRGLLLFVLLVNLLGAALTGIGDPLSLKLLIDSLSRSDKSFFLVLTGVMILVYTSFRLVNYVSDLYSQKLRNRLCQRLVLQLMEKVFRLPYQRLINKEREYFIARCYDEPVKVMEAVRLIVDLFASLAIATCATAVCLFISWKVSLIVSLIVPVLVLLSRRFGSKIREISLHETESEAQLREGLGRSIDSYKNVRLLGRRSYVLDVSDRLLDVFLRRTYRRHHQAALFRTWSDTFLSSAETTVMIVAGFQVLQGSLTIGGLFGFISAYWRVVNAFHSLGSLVPAIAEVGAQLQRIQEIREAPEVVAERSRGGKKWSLRNLSVGYGEGPAVIDAFDFEWSPGERVLITGANGSGKSTIAHVLAGFLEARDGMTHLPGIAATSAVLSPPAFLPGTLQDNLGHASDESQMQNLLNRFGLSDKLAQDPISFSDGEKKKAQIIMALLKDAESYIFDEPLANVDQESKEVIMNEILGRTEKRGLIVIMHGDERYRASFDRVLDLGPGIRAHSSESRSA